MKLVQSLIVAAALAIPAVSSFAQSNQPVTRAEVKAQLAQQDQLESIRTGLLREKAVSHAMSRATIAGA